jgi:hypothetical protein
VSPKQKIAVQTSPKSQQKVSPDPKVLRQSLSNKQVKIMLANSASQAAIGGRSSIELAAKGMIAAGRVSPKQLQLKQA